VATARDLWVITDEVYERVTWAGRRHVPIVTRPGMRERTITIVGLSKAFSMGGWRIALVFAPPPILASLVKLQQHLVTCATSFVQAGAARALVDPPPPEVVTLWADWEQRCTFACDELATMPGVACRRPEGGFYAWADIRELGSDSAAVARHLLLEHRVAVVPGAAFGPHGEGFLRVTCVRSWDELREGLLRMRNAFAALAAPSRTIG
jgi:aspartate/methionine/tyrosine aminotransferase